nr:hypothetical protein [Tanacetum cinerariifolium]
MEANKSINRPDTQNNLYNALVESYNSGKDIITSYCDVLLLKRGRDDQDKDEDPSAGSDRETTRKKSSKDVESSKDSRSKEKKSSSTSKDASQSQHKSSGKSIHAEEPSHTVEESTMQQDQEFTWITQAALADEPPTSFDKFNDTSFDFSAFVLNRLKILNLTQEILLDDEETMDDEEDDEVLKELYEDVNVNLEKGDAEMTDANQIGSEQQNKADEPVQSSSVSFDFTSKFLNLENPSLVDNEIASLMETSAPHATVISEIIFGFTKTIPPPPSFFNPLLQQQTPTFTTITSTNPTMPLPEIPNFASVFKFDQRVSALEYEMSELKQTNQFTEDVSLISAIVDKYIASTMKDVDSTMKKIINDQVKDQISKMMPEIEKYVTETLGAEVLVRSTNQPQTAYAVATSLSKFELKKILIDKMEA